MKVKNKKRNNKGFTVVEMLVVITIIGVMASFVGVGYFGYVDQSKKAVANIEAQEIYKAIELSIVNNDFSTYTSVEQLEDVESATLVNLLQTECGMSLPSGCVVEISDGTLTYKLDGITGTYKYEWK